MDIDLKPSKLDELLAEHMGLEASIHELICQDADLEKVRHLDRELNRVIDQIVELTPENRKDFDRKLSFVMQTIYGVELSKMAPIQKLVDQARSYPAK